jgi:D-xylose transport system permease protein
LSEENIGHTVFRATKLTPMLGMIAALLIIWIGFDIYSGILRPADGLLAAPS